MFYTLTLYAMIATMKKILRNLAIIVLFLVTNSALAIEYSHYFDFDGQRVFLESAKSEREKIRGLAKRDHLLPNTGMVFLYEGNQEQAFWMKNVSFPLDIIFLKDGVVTRLYKNTQPCTTDICKIYPSKGVIDQVVEVPAGFCKLHKLKKKSIIRVKELEQ